MSNFKFCKYVFLIILVVSVFKCEETQEKKNNSISGASSSNLPTNSSKQNKTIFEDGPNLSNNKNTNEPNTSEIKHLINQNESNKSNKSSESNESNEAQPPKSQEIPEDKTEIDTQAEDIESHKPKPTKISEKEHNMTIGKSEEISKHEDDEENELDHEFKDEDQMAKRGFYITVSFLTIFILLFVYNLIRCYTRSPQVEKHDSRGYSRELQSNSAVEDDAVLDLSVAH